MNISQVFADKSDCWTFAAMSYSNSTSADNWFQIINLSWWTDSNRYSNFLSNEQQINIIDKESLNTAMLNLKKYCCEQELWWLSASFETCKKDKTFFNDNVIDSPYLFDHLFDVVMRRLSGLTGESDIYTETSMSSDAKWLEWRSWINEQAENISWANPQIIINKYQQFWQPSSPQSWYDISEKLNTTFWGLSDQDFLTYVSGQWWTVESSNVAKALKNYENRTLYDRYNNACAITQYLYTLLDLWVTSEDKIKIINQLSNNQCSEVIKKQIDNENTYVKLVILQAWNLFLQNYRQWYFSYLQDRTETLQTTRKNISDKFLDVVRGVPHLVRSCVK